MDFSTKVKSEFAFIFASLRKKRKKEETKREENLNFFPPEGGGVDWAGKK